MSDFDLEVVDGLKLGGLLPDGGPNFVHRDPDAEIVNPAEQAGGREESGRNQRTGQPDRQARGKAHPRQPLTR